MVPTRDDPKKAVTVVCIFCGQEFVGVSCPNASKTDHDKDGPKFRKCGDCKSAAPVTGECPTCEKRRKEEAEKIEKQDERNARLEKERHERLIALEKEKFELEKERDRFKAERDVHSEEDRHKRLIALEIEKFKIEKERNEDRVELEVDRKMMDELQRQERAENYIKCGECGLEYDRTLKGCPSCIVGCVKLGCGFLYNKRLLECPRCALPREYNLRVDKDSDDVNSQWELKVFFFEQVGSEKAVALNAIVSVNDPLGATTEEFVTPQGRIVHLKYSEKSRDVSFSLVDSDLGNVNVEPKKTTLEGRPCKFHRTTPTAANSWFKDFVRALKGE